MLWFLKFYLICVQKNIPTPSFFYCRVAYRPNYLSVFTLSVEMEITKHEVLNGRLRTVVMFLQVQHVFNGVKIQFRKSNKVSNLQSNLFSC